MMRKILAHDEAAKISSFLASFCHAKDFIYTLTDLSKDFDQLVSQFAIVQKEIQEKFFAHKIPFNLSGERDTGSDRYLLCTCRTMRFNANLKYFNSTTQDENTLRMF